jgi:hypothetical protein
MMITSRRNQIWGRIYDIGKNESGRTQCICTSGGPYVKTASLHLSEFDFNQIKIDRSKFAEQLRQHRKTERNKHAEKR